jgi:hypothetical protein
MGWFVLAGFLVVIGAGSAIYPFAVRSDRRRAEARIGEKQTWLRRTLWIMVALALLSTATVLVFIK